MNQQPRTQLHLEVETWIDSLPEIVWQLLVNVSNWNAWNDKVGVIRSNAPLDVGQDFIFRIHQTRIHATVYIANKNRSLSWRGEGRGITTQRSWLLIPHNGGTLVVTELYAEGSMVQIAPAEVKRLLHFGIYHWLQCLRSEAEQQVMALA